MNNCLAVIPQSLTVVVTYCAFYMTCITVIYKYALVHLLFSFRGLRGFEIIAWSCNIKNKTNNACFVLPRSRRRFTAMNGESGFTHHRSLYWFHTLHEWCDPKVRCNVHKSILVVFLWIRCHPVASRSICVAFSIFFLWYKRRGKALRPRYAWSIHVVQTCQFRAPCHVSRAIVPQNVYLDHLV